MSTTGVAASRALAANTLSIIETFGPDDWAADTACHGWRVHDLITHMGFFFNFIADSTLVLPDNPSGKSERLNDAAVRERADWTADQVVEYYRAQSEAGLATLEALQGPDFTDATVDMLDLGTYRLAALADAVAFDHLVHLTCDLLAPRGPIAGGDVDVAAAIDPAVDWMIAGLPQMCRVALHPTLTEPIGLRLTGTTERTFVLDRGVDDTVVVTETGHLPADVATTNAVDFLSWATTRTAWRSAVTVTGDRTLVSAVLDAVDVV
ncbi:maleylpyruvate isomerase N-terminal domain-containing protein [Rhodococcus gannanensis]|uniref:Maleylpyruvate isomerase N-terminal domain-containing protein n=1 Tax=Rhodococcus gannanensis TaxID=1960308 RepID=A0ABW4P6E1_9NOCA